jgi:hypothetical protein
MITNCRLPGALTLLLFIGMCVISPDLVDGKTFLYLFDPDGNVLKLDTDTDTIVSRQTLQNVSLSPDDEWLVFDSPADNLLLVSHGREQFRIATFSLKSLAFRKDLGVISSASPRALIPPRASHFFLDWVDPGTGGGAGKNVMTRFDKASLSRIDNLPQYPSLGNRRFFSPDGNRLYSYVDDSQDAVRIFDTGNLQLLSTLDIPPLFAPNLWGKAIEDIQGDRMLLAENTKSRRTDPDRISLFTVRLIDGSRSPRIVTGLEGDASLSPLGDKVIFNETTTIRAPDGSISRIQSVGRLHVYDVATGGKLGQVTFPVHGEGAIEAIHPRGNKVYFYSGAFQAKDRTLASLSLVTFTLLKEITVPPVLFTIVFDEP